MFVVRLAGNTATPSAVASLDYAVEHLGIELLVVLGHTDCGAVRAAREGHCEGIFGAVTSPICDIVAAHPGEDADLTAARNVTRTIVDLEAHDGPTGRAIRDGRVRIEGAIHDVRSARLRSPDSFLTTRTTLTTPTITTPTS